MAKRVSLTFDNGPTPGITDQVLDALAEFGIKATFFLVGYQLEMPEGLELALRAAREGHRFGNHSYNHGAPLGLREQAGEAEAEILRMQDLLGQLAGDELLYRPNGRGTIGEHLFNKEAIATLEKLAATIVLWTSVPRDRQVVVESPEIWLEDAKSAVLDQDWPVIVLHDRPSGFPLPGPMSHLRKFLAWANDSIEFTLEFPMSVTPMRNGVAGPDLNRYVTD